MPLRPERAASSLVPACRRILAERSAPGSFAYAFFLGLFAFLTDFHRSHTGLLVAGGLVLLAVGALRYGLYQRFDPVHALRPDAWYRLFLAATLAMAASWAVITSYVIVRHPMSWEVHLAIIIIAGLTTGGVTTLSADAKLARWFVATILVPPGATALIAPGDGNGAVALIIGLFLTYCLALVRIQNRHIREQVRTTLLLRARTAEAQHARTVAEKASAAKSQLLANVSHELRTPINGMLGLTELALAEELPSRAREHLTLALDSGRRLMTLVEDLLDFSNLESDRADLQWEPFDLRRLAKRCLAERTARNASPELALRLELADGVPERARGDARALACILGHLLDNAVEFTAAGEVVLALDVRRLDAGRLELHGEVRDTGCGIPSGVRDAIFDAFTQGDGSASRRHGGIGLGLAITRRLVHLLDGEIRVRSEEDQGSVFAFTVMLEAEAETEAAPSATVDAPAAPEPEPPPPPLDVLLVEDNPVNARVLVRLLEGRGHRTVLAENGVLALERLAEHRFDLVLMDVQMPEMDGLEATRRIRAGEVAGTERVPIVAVTAHASREDRERCLAAGMDDYLTKPLATNRLDSMLRQVAGRAPVPA